MKTYLQFKDNIVFGYNISEKEIDGLMELPNNLDISDVLYKKYENNQWVQAPTIRYIDKLSALNNKILSINETVFPSDVKGEIISEDVQELYVLHNAEWIPEEILKKETKPINNPSWQWNLDLLIWQPPIPMPETDGSWEWNEEAQEWQELS